MIVNVEITVFTPTYNRAYIINRLYESLQRQEIHNFEWLVVDDGSVDETEELFRTWMNNESKFPIRYYKKKNGGKCRAINFALDLAQGKLFFVVDSDDYLTDDALKKIIAWEKSLPKDEKYCGVAGNLGMSSNFTPNTLFETDYYDGTLLDRYRNIDGERALAFFTEIHKKYRYPEYSGEKFMTEAVIYNRMANDGYKMRFYNDIVWIYEYRSDGLTKAGNSLFLNNPRGYGLWLKEKALFMNFSLIKRIKMYYTFSCDLIGKYSTKVIAECIGAPVVMIRALISIHTLGALIRRKRQSKALVEVAHNSVGLNGKIETKSELYMLLEEQRLWTSQLEAIKKVLEEIIRRVSYVEKLFAIKRVGSITIAGFIAEVGDIRRFDSPKQIQHKGRTRISKRGRRKHRKIWYQVMVSLLARNKEFRGIYDHYVICVKNPLKR